MYKNLIVLFIGTEYFYENQGIRVKLPGLNSQSNDSFYLATFFPHHLFDLLLNAKVWLFRLPYIESISINIYFFFYGQYPAKSGPIMVKKKSKFCHCFIVLVSHKLSCQRLMDLGHSVRLPLSFFFNFYPHNAPGTFNLDFLFHI